LGKNSRMRKQFRLLKGGKNVDNENQKMFEATQQENGCWNCRHWIKYPAPNPIGMCTESPPQCIALPHQQPMINDKSLVIGGPVKMVTQWAVQGFFPPTGPHVICGRHQQRKGELRIVIDERPTENPKGNNN